MHALRRRPRRRPALATSALDAASLNLTTSKPEESLCQHPDPRDVGPKPPFPEQPQDHPGTIHQLKPKADHGEESYKGSGKLAGQCAFVTGADSGIGRAIAIAYAKEGADVVLSYLEEEEADAREVVAIIKGCGRSRSLSRVISALPNMPAHLSKLRYESWGVSIS